MQKLTCKHCGGDIQMGNKICPHCGIPLPANAGTTPQQRFILLFIGIIILCVVTIIWLPPDWTRFIK